MTLPDWMRCIDCDRHHTGYMVKPHIWKLAGMPHQAVVNGKHVKGGCLCTTCLAKRIGRALVLNDFTNAPINAEHPLWKRLCESSIKGRKYECYVCAKIVYDEEVDEDGVKAFRKPLNWTVDKFNNDRCPRHGDERMFATLGEVAVTTKQRNRK